MLKFFSTEDYEKELESLELREELMNAVKDGFTGFSVCYQPQMHPVDFSLFGAEALLRFTSPTRGGVSPMEFIPGAVRSHLFCGPVGSRAGASSVQGVAQVPFRLPHQRECVVYPASGQRLGKPVPVGAEKERSTGGCPHS